MRKTQNKISCIFFFRQSPYGAGQAETPPPAYSPRDDPGQQHNHLGQQQGNMQPSGTSNMMDTDGNHAMDTTSSLMHAQPVEYVVRF